MVKVYREVHGLFFCNSIAYNHESPRRGENFVTRKITLGAARIKLGMQDQLALGDIDAARDWGDARDFVQAMWLMLQQDRPGDYVLASGETHTIRAFLDHAFGHLGLDWKAHVVHDSRFDRPHDVSRLLGDASRAHTLLGWQPEYSFADMVRDMVESDLAHISSTIEHML